MTAETARCVVVCLTVALLPAGTAAAETRLPVGTHPAPVEFSHFPHRLHAVVWRNWGLVEPVRLAETLGASVEQISAVAESMGLDPAPAVSSEFRQRGYITLLRRNWHLLPYDQLLMLLDMTAEELDFALREDDFLYVKLGQLKPACEPVRYAPPSDEARARAEEIKQVVEQYFADAGTGALEPRFAFVEQLSRVDGDVRPPVEPGRMRDGLRFIYSYFGAFGDPLLDADRSPYPDGLLARLADTGVNGVWLHTVLRQLAPGGEHFPEFGQDHEKRLANLRELVERARHYGIGVYLYMNEPRAMPHAFFEDRPEMAGVQSGNLTAMCTSDPRVRQWVTDALAHVFTHVPGLAGVFTITASENLTNCATRMQQVQCPRCRDRSQAAIVAEVNAAIEAGVHQGNPEARVIAWDWGWNNHGEAAEHIARLPDSVWLMSVSEWAKPIERGGVGVTVGEYSISAVGPGPRARAHWQLARQRGLPTVAKVQFNNTWELSAVPFLPVLDLVAEHCARLARDRVDGTMLSWSLGGYPSPNLRVAQQFAEQPEATVAAVLDDIAARRYGADAAPHARRAWTAFSKAFRQFPYHGTVLYRAPQQFGPSNLLFAERTGYAATMVGFPYDDVDGWRGPYPPHVLAEQFQRVADGWAEGLEAMKEAVEQTPPDRRETAEADSRVARAAHLHFASVANQIRFVLARDRLADEDIPATDRRQLREQILQLLDDETDLARQLFAIVRQDSRIGFEATNHYYYLPRDLIEKVLNCEHLRGQYE